MRCSRQPYRGEGALHSGFILAFVLAFSLVPLAHLTAQGNRRGIARRSTRAEREQEQQNLYQQAMSHLKQGQFEQAIPLFEGIVRRDPNHADAYNYLGETYYELGQYQEAVRAFEIAIGIQPKHVRAKMNLEVARWQLPATMTTFEPVTGVSELLLQGTSGYLRGAVVGTLMYLGGSLVGLRNDPGRTQWLVAGAGVVLGSSLQVYQIGETVGQGGGSQVKTTVGALIGPFVGALIAVWADDASSDRILTGAGYGSLVSPIGATLGYQLSRHNVLSLIASHPTPIPRITTATAQATGASAKWTALISSRPGVAGLTATLTRRF